MPLEDWRKAYLYSRLVWGFFFGRVGFFVTCYLKVVLEVDHMDFIAFLVEEGQKHKKKYARLNKAICHAIKQCDIILQNGPQLNTLEDYGPTGFTPHEAIVTILLEQPDTFYEELKILTESYCISKELKHTRQEIEDLIRYQKSSMLLFGRTEDEMIEFKYNTPEIFKAILAGKKPPTAQPIDNSCRFSYNNDMPKNKLDFAKSRSRSIMITEIREATLLDGKVLEAFSCDYQETSN